MSNSVNNTLFPKLNTNRRAFLINSGKAVCAASIIGASVQSAAATTAISADSETFNRYIRFLYLERRQALIEQQTYMSMRNGRFTRDEAMTNSIVAANSMYPIDHMVDYRDITALCTSPNETPLHRAATIMRAVSK